MFQAHPCKALNDAFAARPFQGVPPHEATFLFVGLDANYSCTIDENAIFPKLLEYLLDGAAFWRKYGVHHPFLLPEYGRGDGWAYHKQFSRIGFRPEHAELVSFVELVNVPTYGTSSLALADLNREHLTRVAAAIDAGPARYIFIPSSVARWMRASSLFPWMPREPIDQGRQLKLWEKRPNKAVCWHYHFSHAFNGLKKTAQLREISELVGAV
jgi:hypothetical protein